MEKKENMEIVEEKKELDFTELENRLDELDSNAFINAERACRMTGDPTPDIVYSAARGDGDGGPIRGDPQAEAAHLYGGHYKDAEFFIAVFGRGADPAQQLRGIIFALREAGSLDYWQRQTLRELRRWMDVIEQDRARRE